MLTLLQYEIVTSEGEAWTALPGADENAHTDAPDRIGGECPYNISADLAAEINGGVELYEDDMLRDRKDEIFHEVYEDVRIDEMDFDEDELDENGELPEALADEIRWEIAADAARDAEYDLIRQISSSYTIDQMAVFHDGERIATIRYIDEMDTEAVDEAVQKAIRQYERGAEDLIEVALPLPRDLKFMNAGEEAYYMDF